jgi:hypothetical protein
MILLLEEAENLMRGWPGSRPPGDGVKEILPVIWTCDLFIYQYGVVKNPPCKGYCRTVFP